ncbi:MAG: HAD family hydrolase [Promethearchaeota archaeon]
MDTTKAIDFSEIKLIIFDLDGTIIPLHKRFYAVWSDTITKFNLPNISWDDFMQRIEEDSLMETIDHSIRKAFMKTFLSAYSQYWSPDETTIPGAREVLTQLKKAGFKLALATGRISSIEDLADEMKSLNLNELFDVITAKKSEEETFDNLHLKNKQIKYILEKLNIPSSNALIVGDYITDIRSGKLMGLKTIVVLSSKIAKEILKQEKPDMIIESIKTLSQVIFDESIPEIEEVKK